MLLLNYVIDVMSQAFHEAMDNMTTTTEVRKNTNDSATSEQTLSDVSRHEDI